MSQRDARAERFGIVGLVFALVGGVLGVLAFTVLPWLQQDDHSNDFQAKSSESTFGKLHTRLDDLQHYMRLPRVSDHVHLGVAPTYFSWLGWALLAVAFVLAVLAVAPLGRGVAVLRPAAAVVALAGLGLTFWTIDLFTYDVSLARYFGARSASFGQYLGHGFLGFWAALAAFLLVGIGALVGPRRVPTPEAHSS